MKLKCRIVGNKKVLVIPSIYHDMFKEGEKYRGMTCAWIARYKCLIIPSLRYDEFEEGREYEIII